MRVNTHAAPTLPLSARAADQGGVPVRRQRHAEAEPAGAGLAAAGQLAALLRPGGARAGEHPRRADVAVVAGAADQRGVPVGRQRHADSRTCRRRSRRWR